MSVAINTTTGEVSAAPKTPLESAQMRAEVAEADLRLAEEEIRSQRRTINGLKAQLNQSLTQTDEGKVAQVIARYYVARLSKKANWIFGEKRQKAVVGRLKEGHTPLMICRAIDWIAVGAYVNSETGERYDDLELVCRNEVNLEKYSRLAEQNAARTMLDAAWRSDLGERDVSELTPSEGDPTTKSRAADAEALPERVTDLDVEGQTN